VNSLGVGERFDCLSDIIARAIASTRRSAHSATDDAAVLLSQLQELRLAHMNAHSLWNSCSRVWITIIDESGSIPAGS
jgi:hypothetical protein